jgi:hypothetical protein
MKLVDVIYLELRTRLGTNQSMTLPFLWSLDFYLGARARKNEEKFYLSRK